MPASLLCEVTNNFSLKRYNTWHIGGLAKNYYCPKSIIDLSLFFKHLDPAESVYYLGLGSNLLISDQGFAGTVIHLSKLLAKVELLSRADETTILRAEAGLPCPQLARYCMQQDLCGLEFFAGIPGTVGGALAMNAGAFGGQTWEQVVAIETVDRNGVLRIRYPNEFSVGYRKVDNLDSQIIVAGHFQLQQGVSIELKNKIRELLQKRKQSQPIGKLSCGSVFKNPPEDYAARLISAVKLKGERVGGAEVSIKHANFILNTGDATANDVIELIRLVRNRVKSEFGILLEPEVKFMGIEEPL